MVLLQKDRLCHKTDTCCFANLVEQTMESIDAMEIGGFPAYLYRKPAFIRLTQEQIDAQHRGTFHSKIQGFSNGT
jgi:hypothetical protein